MDFLALIWIAAAFLVFGIFVMLNPIPFAITAIILTIFTTLSLRKNEP